MDSIPHPQQILYGLCLLLAPLLLAAATVGVLAAVAGTNFGVQGIYRAILDTTVAVGALAPAEVAAAVVAFYLPGILFPLTLLVFGGLLLRARVVPVWCGVLICLGAIAFPTSRIPRIQWIALLADLSLLVPLFWMSWQHFRRGLGQGVPDQAANPATAMR